mgnify:FL=1|jgi:methionyl-tRNA formyltransferase|tara:strand:+ start:9344 stop:10015 length:672 start_codon:yes stop_codon:yes gene_type:complete
MIKKILLIARRNDSTSKKIINFLKKKKVKLNILWSNKPNEELKINKIYDYILSYRSYYIFKKKDLKNKKTIIINFHPGPPKYRGFGCGNYAIWNKDKEYACTAHLINQKIDNGKIFDVKKFPIEDNINLNTLLKKTYQKQLLQFKKCINLILKDKNNLNTMIKKSKKYSWSKKLYTKKQLDKFYEINPKLEKIELERKIRSIKLENEKFKPYIMIHKRKFVLH